MAELVTVARPYAEAAFRSAVEKQQVAASAEQLALVAAIAADPQMVAVLGNPRVSVEQKKQLFAAAAGGRLTGDVQSLVGMLVDNHREALIASVAQQFEDLKHEHEKVVRAKITSAQALTEAQRQDIVAALERKYGRKVEAELEVDPSLLGGARVQVGDQVTNASVRDALAQMAMALSR